MNARDPHRTVSPGAGGGRSQVQRVGDYVIDAELGRGGMGSVYRARHASLGRVGVIHYRGPVTVRRLPSEGS